MFEPHLEILPAPQRNLWGELAQVPGHFVLYGGTALSLRLAHRQSFDFDFFSNKSVDTDELLTGLALLRGAKVLQNAGQTLTVEVNRKGSVKLSFFGEISIGRVGIPEKTADGVLKVASLLDLAGTKAKVVLQRAESKDYLDLLAIFKSGISLPQAMAAAKALYGEQYNPMLTVKSLSYFGDGDLHKLTPEQKSRLEQIASVQDFSLPALRWLGDELSGGI
ncbi:MAG: nucleotidyl transferase AbiEii/AbiGii toxin family protein [Limisphaerales bacterium]